MTAQPELNFDFPTGPCPFFSFFGDKLYSSYVGFGANYFHNVTDSSILLGKERTEIIEGKIRLTFTPFITIIPKISLGGGYLLRSTKEFESGTAKPQEDKGWIFFTGISLEKPISERMGFTLSYERRSFNFLENALTTTITLGLTIQVF